MNAEPPRISRHRRCCQARSCSASGCRRERRAQAKTSRRRRRRLVRGSDGARDQRVDRDRARRHRHDPHRADRARPRRLDLERDDGLRGAAVRLEQGPPAVRVRESRRARRCARVDAERAGQRRARIRRAAASPAFGNRAAHGRCRNSRQPLSTNADERRVVGQGRPLLPAACRRRSARASACSRRPPCGTCRSPS